MNHPFQNSPVSPIVQPAPPLQQTIHTTYTLADLPLSYRTLLTQFGAGYLTHTKLATIEPTRDGLDYVLLNGIFGWSTTPSPLETVPFKSLFAPELQPDHTQLPHYFVVFFVDGNKYFCFDFSQLSQTNQPSIRFIDTEMDQWLHLADSFEQLIERLTPHNEPLTTEPEIPYTWHAINQYLAQPTLTEQALTTLLMLYQDSDHKRWYFQWLDFWLHSPHACMRQVAKDAIRVQLDYFAATLALVTDYLQKWSTESTIRDDATFTQQIKRSLQFFCDS